MSDHENETSGQRPAGAVSFIGRVIGLVVVAVIAMLYFVGMGDVSSGMYGGSMGSLNMLLDLIGLALAIGVVLIVVVIYKLAGRSRSASPEDKEPK